MTDLAVIERTRGTLRELGRGKGPILVGPWLSEVGFELLYWIPFLRWAIRFAGLRPEDIWIVSRGGCRSWYADISPHYLDILDFYTPEEFRSGNEQRIAAQSSRAASLGLRTGAQSPKQHEISLFDEVILATARAATGHDFLRVLHPSLMYAFFKPFWKRKAPNLHTDATVVVRMTPPALDLALPSSYVAIKFYVSNCLPDTDEHRRLVQNVVRAQAETSDVVLLHGGPRYDEHGVFPVAAHPRVHHVALPPNQNLDIQTAVIARASSFVGTYGGFAYLAPFLGVPARTVYGLTNFRTDHMKVMERLAGSALRVPFAVESISSGPQVIARRSRHRAA